VLTASKLFVRGLWRGRSDEFLKARIGAIGFPYLPRHAGRNLNRNRTSESVVLERVHGCFSSQSF
jgi:hypothetical protein